MLSSSENSTVLHVNVMDFCYKITILQKKAARRVALFMCLQHSLLSGGAPTPALWPTVQPGAWTLLAHTEKASPPFLPCSLARVMWRVEACPVTCVLCRLRFRVLSSRVDLNPASVTVAMWAHALDRCFLTHY